MEMVAVKKWFMLVSMILCLAVSVPAESSATELYSAGINLIPYPQQVELGGDNFMLGGKLVIVVDNNASEADRFAAEELARGIEKEWDVKVSVGKSPAAKSIILTRKGGAEKLGDQGYDLSVTSDKVTIEANGEAGLFYGTQTLLQVIQKGDSGAYVKGMEITDWPDIEQRAVHYDTKHHQDKAEYVRSFIRDMAGYKINMLVWEWEDKFAYPSHPEIGAPGAFTMEEMQAFTRYARKYHVQLVPLVQGLGHVSFILKWPQYAHLREIAASNWEFCPLKDGSYELMFDLWEDAIKATPGSEYIHIGSDETYEVGQGVECGCKAKAEEIGKSGLYHIFINKAVKHLMSPSRKVMAWERALGWEKSRSPAKGIVPVKGLVLTESGDYGDDYSYVTESKKRGYPVFFYDPNPGIEHLFLPYYYKMRGGKATDDCLVNSHRQLSAAATAGVFDGMINTSWDDSGLHNQVWMMSFVNSAEFSWSGANPGLDEFREKYFKNYYGDNVKDMAELFTILSKSAYYYMDTFERNVWHHGDIGKTHVPDLPRDDSLEYDPFWRREYKEITDRSKAQSSEMDRALKICRDNLGRGVKNSYDFEIFISLIDLLKHTCQTYMDLAELEGSITQAHRQRFVSHRAAYEAMEQAAELVEKNLAERDEVFNNLVTVFKKTSLPKGMSTADKKFFHRQDRARHFANRRADMTYLICDEQLLDLEGYLKKLREYMAWYKETFL